MIEFAITTDFEPFKIETEGSIVSTEKGSTFAPPSDIDRDMINPSKILTDIADKYDIKISFMLDIISYERFAEEEDYCESIDRLNAFMADAVKNGHDIQIHAHPEWVHATYKDGKWFRPYGNDVYKTAHDMFDDYFTVYDKSIVRLRKLLGETWEPTVFRAGAYHIDPVESLFEKLAERGILCDTSRHINSGKGNSPTGPWQRALPHWRAQGAIPCENYFWEEGALMEIPIFGTRQIRWDLNFPESYSNCFQLDDNQEYIPIVMMGHTKMNHDFEKLDTLFSDMAKKTNFKSVTISDMAKKTNEENYKMPKTNTYVNTSEAQWKDGSMEKPYIAGGDRYKLKTQYDKLLQTLPLDKYKTIADIGCGSGALVNMLRERYQKDIVGVDSSPSSIAQAQRTFPKDRYEVGDYRTWRPKTPIDAVLMVDCYYQIPKNERIEGLKHIYSYLRPGGAIIITGPFNEKMLGSATTESYGTADMCSLELEIASIFKLQQLITWRMIDHETREDMNKKIYVGEK